MQLAMISCSYNFIKLSMCIYNFNVAVRISINLTWLKQEKVFIKCMINDKEQVLDLETDSTYNMCEDRKEPVRKLK